MNLILTCHPIRAAWLVKDLKLITDETITSCPLLVHLSVPPLPSETTQKEIELYDAEIHNPTGLRVSLPHPVNYWEGVGLGGVIVADQCGWAFGLEGGTGIKIDEFWDRSINCESGSRILVIRVDTDLQTPLLRLLPNYSSSASWFGKWNELERHPPWPRSRYGRS